MKLDKSNKLLIGLGLVSAVFIGRLAQIQLIDHRYRDDAINNSMVYQTIYPVRGIIHDRDGDILVGNKTTYDLLVTPRDVEEFDTTALCQMLGVSREFVDRKFEEYHRNRRKIGYQSVTMIKQMDPKVYMKFAEVAYLFPGFSSQVRTVREYPFNAGGNLLGYVSEVDQSYISSHSEYYPGDYAGMTGIEAAREDDLRGEKGYSVYLRNSHNKIMTHYRDGELDKEAVPGKDITTTIDATLQNYGQQLMKNKVGSLVAIEPSTGEILAIVSSPGIDVDILADFGSHYSELLNNPYKPMFNRAVQTGTYPPGSVFKLVNGLIGLQEGVLAPSTRYPCSMGYHFGKNTVGCHSHPSPLNFEQSIMMSCNAYYCYVLRSILENGKYSNIEEALDQWNRYVRSFGFGSPLGSDFPSEKGGVIPDSEYYNKNYRKGGWKATTVISLSIGQGEIGCTPLHLANLAATIANRGYYYIPHIIKDSENIKIDPKYKKRNYTLIDTLHFPRVVEGMYRAVNSGYGSGATASIAHVDGLDICGKTGTAQNPHGEDNSVFICFAPKDNPKIAVAAYVENAGFGATWAAPIASLLVEKYLKGDITGPVRKWTESRILQGDLMDKVTPN